MQEQIEEMEMQIGKVESGKNIKTKTDIALLRMRIEALESRVEVLNEEMEAWKDMEAWKGPNG